MDENKYARSVAARREEDASKRLREYERQRREREARERQEWEIRSRGAVFRAEFAFEAVKALLPMLRKNDRLGPATLNRLHELAKEIGDQRLIVLFRLDKPIDHEDRRETPKPRQTPDEES